MGIESGPSINVGGPAFGAAAFAGESFGSVNEGPVLGSLEGFRPMNKTDIRTIDKGGVREPLGEIVFNPNSLTAESAVAQAEVIIAEAKVSSPINKLDTAVTPLINPAESLSKASVVEEAQYWLGINEPVLTEPGSAVVGSGLDVTPDSLPFRHSYSDTVSSELQAVSPASLGKTETVYAPAIQEQLVEEIVKQQKIKVEDRINEPSETREEEEIDELKIKYVEDEAVSSQRRFEIREAIKRAKVEAEKEGVEGVEGWRIRKYYQPEHEGIRSQIAEPGIADGSLVETYQDISVKTYASEKQANEVVDSVVDDKKPVKKAKEGKKVKERDIARIRRDPFLKRHPVEEVVARIVKKSTVETKLGQKPVEVTTAVQKEDFTEGRIEDYPELAEVFQKVA
jgi:hypothetical protein